MSQFFSFVITVDGRCLTGNTFSHEGIASGWNLTPGEYRDAEWTDENLDTLHIWAFPNDHKLFWAWVVTEHWHAQKRSELLEKISEGRVYHNNTKYRLKNGLWHTDDDTPAIVGCNGVWYCKNGLFHRDGDKPAAILGDGSEEHWLHGKLSRHGDKPAVIRADGCREYWVDGVQVKTEYELDE